MITDQAEALEYLGRLSDVQRKIQASDARIARAKRLHDGRKRQRAELLKLRDRLMADTIEDRPLFDAPRDTAHDRSPSLATPDRDRTPRLVTRPDDAGDRGLLPDLPPVDPQPAIHVDAPDGAPTRVYLVIGKDGKPSYGVRAETIDEATEWNHSYHTGDWDLAIVDPEVRRPGGKPWVIPPTGFLVFDVAEERERKAKREQEAAWDGAKKPKKKARKSKAKVKADQVVIETDLEKVLEAESEADEEAVDTELAAKAEAEYAAGDHEPLESVITELRDVEDTPGGGYTPDHPWYYKCGGRILTVEEIKVANISEESALFAAGKLPKDPGKRKAKLLVAIEKAKTDLARDVESYRETVEAPIEEEAFAPWSCSSHDTNLSLTHNHVSYGKGMILALQALLDPIPAKPRHPSRAELREANAQHFDALRTAMEARTITRAGGQLTSQHLDAIGVPELPEDDNWRLSDIWELDLSDALQVRAESEADNIGELFDTIKLWAESDENAHVVHDAIMAFRERCHRNHRIAEERRAAEAKPQSKTRVEPKPERSAHLNP